MTKIQQSIKVKQPYPHPVDTANASTVPNDLLQVQTPGNIDAASDDSTQESAQPPKSSVLPPQSSVLQERSGDDNCSPPAKETSAEPVLPSVCFLPFFVSVVAFLSCFCLFLLL